MALTVQQQVKAEADTDDTEKERWSEVVDDLWENKLPHLRDEIYNGAFVYDPQTGRYGFQEGSDYDSEEDVTSISSHSLSYNQQFYNDGANVYDPQTGQYRFTEDYNAEELNKEEDHLPKGDAEESFIGGLRESDEGSYTLPFADVLSC